MYRYPTPTPTPPSNPKPANPKIHHILHPHPSLLSLNSFPLRFLGPQRKTETFGRYLLLYPSQALKTWQKSFFLLHSPPSKKNSRIAEYNHVSIPDYSKPKPIVSSTAVVSLFCNPSSDL